VTETLTVGFRFNRSDAPKLRALADRVKVNDLRSDVGVFEQAADAAERQELLIVHADSLDEVRQLAIGYVFNGVDAPTIESVRT
jgi:hypothetical protein